MVIYNQFFYSLLSVAFQLHMTRAFGHAGFLVFWMLNWVGMLSVCVFLTDKNHFRN